MIFHKPSMGKTVLFVMFMIIVAISCVLLYMESGSSYMRWQESIFASDLSEIKNCVDNDESIDLDSPIRINHDKFGIFETDSLVPPIVLLASRGDGDSLEYLLEHGASPDSRGPKMRTAIYWAARNSHAHEIDILAKHHADLEIRDEYEITALMVAAREGCTQCAYILLEQGANANAQTSNGDTALLIAAGFCNIDIMKLLIDHGADINSESDIGVTAFMNATSQSCLEGMDLLILNGANPDAVSKNMVTTPLIWTAAMARDTKGMNKLLSYNIDINYQDEEGLAALHIAAEYGMPEIVRLLIQNGADPELQDRHGSIPLNYAKLRDEGSKKEEIVSILKAKQGDPKK